MDQPWTGQSQEDTAGMLFGHVHAPQRPNMFAGAFGGNPLVGMAGNMLGEALMGKVGLFPGQLFQQQSFFDQVQAKRFYKDQSAAMGLAAEADKENYYNTLRGLARTMGNPLDTVQKQDAVRTLAGGFATHVTPLLAQFAPEFLEALSGPKGNAQVMTLGLQLGGMRARDPVTGLTGLSGQSSGMIAQQIAKNFFGPDADPRAFHGLGMGKLGQLYEQLQGRGLMPDSVAGMSRDEQVRAMAADPSLVAEQLKKLTPAQHDFIASGMSGMAGLGRDAQVKQISENTKLATDAMNKLSLVDPEKFADAQRGLDTARIKKQLERFSGAIAVVGDIFGHDKPMGVLTQKLQELTQHGMERMAPEDLAHSVRLIQSTAASANINMDQYQMLQAYVAEITDRAGISRSFVDPITQDMVRTKLAFDQTGLGLTPNAQSVSSDEKALIHANLNASAAKSGAANQLGLVQRVVKMLGDQGVAVDSSMKAWAQAIKDDKDVFIDPATGKESNVLKTDREGRAFAAAHGINERDFVAMGHQTDYNQEFLGEGGLNIVRRGQGATTDRIVSRAGTQAALSPLQGLVDAGKLDADRALTIARTASQAAAKQLRVMDNPSDAPARTRIIMDTLRESYREQGIDVRSMTKQTLATVADEIWGEGTKAYAQNPDIRGNKNLLTALEEQNPKMLKRRGEIKEENLVATELRRRLADVGGGGGPLARFIDVLQQPQAGAGQAAGKVLGGIDMEKIREQLGAVRNMTPKELEQLGVKDPERAKAFTDNFGKLLAEYEAAQKEEDPEKKKKALDDIKKGMTDSGILDPKKDAKVGVVVDAGAVPGAPGAAEAPKEKKTWLEALRDFTVGDTKGLKEKIADATETKPMEIRGTLTLQGLDKVLLVAKTDPTGVGTVPAHTG